MKIIKSVEVDNDDLAQLAIDKAKKSFNKSERDNLQAKMRFDEEGYQDGFIVFVMDNEPSTNWPEGIEG